MKSAANDDTPAPTSYLFTLRFWIEHREGRRWRGRLESVSAGHVYHFRSLPRLVSYLRKILDSLTAAQDP